MFKECEKLTSEIRIIPVLGIPLIKEGDNLAKIIFDRIELQDNDIVVICETVVSKSQGRIVDITKINPSNKAKDISKKLARIQACTAYS